MIGSSRAGRSSDYGEALSESSKAYLASVYIIVGLLYQQIALFYLLCHVGICDDAFYLHMSMMMDGCIKAIRLTDILAHIVADC